MNQATAESEIDLVIRSQQQDTSAFEQLVVKHQNLVCAISLAILGDVTASEDVAQDVFLQAWRSLSSLKEPSKFRSWLIGITRNLAHKQLESKHRKWSHANSSDIDDVTDPSGAELLDQLVSAEELQLVWNSLLELPEPYRETLVLYYREGHAVEQVAEQLELSSDAVKQRLLRGRDLIRNDLAAKIEEVLLHTRPSARLTKAIMTSIAVLGMSKSAIAAATPIAANAIAGATSGALIGALGGFAGGLIGAAGGYAGGYAAAEGSQFERERQFLHRFNKWMLIGSLTQGLVFTLGLFTVIYFFGQNKSLITTYCVIGTLFMVGSVFAFVIYALATASKIRLQETLSGTAPREIKLPAFIRNRRGRHFTSGQSFLGLPLIHINVSDPPQRMGEKIEPSVAQGWIAVGDHAYGLIALGNRAFGALAFGGIAVGGLTIGGLSLGLVALGGGAVGLFTSIGGGALGFLAVGGLALGYYALGGVSLGWNAIGGFAGGYVAKGGLAAGYQVAEGGAAYSYHAAVGGFASAPNANNEIAKAAVSEIEFFEYSKLLENSNWVYIPIVVALVAISLLIDRVMYVRINPEIDAT